MSAAYIASLKIAGFNTATAIGTVTGYSGCLGGVTVSLMDDGSLTWTDANSNKRVIDSNPQLNALLAAILTGTNGAPTAKAWSK